VSDNPFNRLAPFIQEYIYNHGWTELRAVQVEACRVLFETDAHLLLATGTASGKTEAAFLPVLTLLHERPATSVAVLYIGPTKALINDQFWRLSDLLVEADIPVWHWHGDVSQSEKKKLLKSPSGVLQITPESLESLLINRRAELGRLFGDLRFVIIDEVHVFMGSDRGRQILCQIQRLSRFLRDEPRRIGLSATLGDYSLAESWLASGSRRGVVTPHVEAGPRTVRLAMEHFLVSAKETGDTHRQSEPAQPQAGQGEPKPIADPFDQFIYDASRGRKCLIFANSRGETESVIAALRQMAERERAPDVYHVHHGSIAKTLREAAEHAMRKPGAPAVTAATVTMELGIDIGQLERVIQLQAPFSVSSFLQRLGRSGRRGEPAEIWFACREEEPTANESLPEQVPWQLLQSIAIVQLYLEERWIEPIQPLQCPFSLLYHQIMSTLVSMGELTPSALAQQVLTLPAFHGVSTDDLRHLLKQLIAIDHIEQTEERGLIVGLAGERIVNNFRFYAVFPDNEEYAVREQGREIGSIIMPPPPGERFGLAGRTWEVLEIDTKRRLVFAKRVGGRVKARWMGSGGNIHSRILQRMRLVLQEDVVYPYLQQHGQDRLEQARRLARNTGLAEQRTLPLGGDTVCVLPWMGTIAYRTLQRALRLAFADSLGIQGVGGLSPYYLTVQTQAGTEALADALTTLAHAHITAEDLVQADEAPQLAKYDEFVPPNLLRKALVADWLDVAEMQRLLAMGG
jgi:ATP-dependent helicase Lhr and Lhr-like helicase